MKKLKFVLLAAVLAIGLSAYSSATKKNTLYFYMENQYFVPVFMGEPPCPIGNIYYCYYLIDGDWKVMYYTASMFDPVMRPF